MLCGYSLGGRLALHAALRAPGRYAGLVTVGAAAGIEAPAARAARAEADEKLARGWRPRRWSEIVAVWERQPLFADQSDVLVEEQRPGRLAQDPRSLALLLRTAGQGALEPVWQRLHSLALPVLAIAGGLDDRYSDAARRIARSVPDGRAAIVEAAGHAPQLQRPDARWRPASSISSTSTSARAESDTSTPIPGPWGTAISPVRGAGSARASSASKSPSVASPHASDSRSPEAS